MPKIIDRYIFREIAFPFLLSISVFTFVLLMGKILHLADLVVNKGVGLWDMFRLVVFMMPALLLFTIPLALLVSILIGLGRLSKDNEIIIFKAAGLSLYRLFLPVLVLSTLAFALTTATSFFLFPEGSKATKRLILNVARQKASAGIKEKVFNDDFKGIVLYADTIPVQGDYMKGVLLFDDRIASQPGTIIAEKGYLVSDPDNPVVTLRLETGSIHSVQPDLRSYRKIEFDTYDVNLDLKTSILDVQKAVSRGRDEMTLPELFSAVRQPGRAVSGTNVRELEIEMNKRMAIPVSCLIFALIGMPLGITSSRSAKLRGFTVGLVVVVLYYLLLLSGTALGETGSLPVALGVWTPNVAFTAAGLGLFHLKASEKDIRFDPWNRLRSRIGRVRPS